MEQKENEERREVNDAHMAKIRCPRLGIERAMIVCSYDDDGS